MTGKILIVDALVTNRIILRVKLSVACYATLQADTLKEGLQLALSEQPELIICGMSLPDGMAHDLCTRLRAEPQGRDIPILVIAPTDDPAPRLQALRAGASEVMVRPMDEGLLMARIRSLLRARDSAEERTLLATGLNMGFAEAQQTFEAPARALLIANSGGAGSALAQQLSSLRAGPQAPLRIDTLPPAEALRPAPSAPCPDLYLLAPDPDTPDADLRMIADLRARPSSRTALICVLLPAQQAAAAAMALDLGASEVLILPLNADEAALRLARLLERKRQADRLRLSTQSGLALAMTDPLTGLHNRRYADQHLRQIAQAACQTGRDFAVMLIDLDRFKLVNDTYGHAAGDLVLTSISRVMRMSTRPQDLLARIGGEEFLLVLPDTGLQAAHRTADRLRQTIAGTDIRLPDNLLQITVTASVGVARGSLDACAADHPVQVLTDAADRALRGAKRLGRNRVMIAQSVTRMPPPTPVWP